MNADLIKRLRTMAAIRWNPIGDEAADAIEALQKKLAEVQAQLRAALEAKVRELEAERDASRLAAEGKLEVVDRSKLRRLVTQVFGEGYRIAPATAREPAAYRYKDRSGFTCYEATMKHILSDASCVEPLYTDDSNEWRDAMHDAGIVCWSLTKENENDPRKLLSAIVDFNVKIALDPAISQDARNLIKMGRDGCVPGSTQQCIG